MLKGEGDVYVCFCFSKALMTFFLLEDLLVKAQLGGPCPNWRAELLLLGQILWAIFSCIK